MYRLVADLGNMYFFFWNVAMSIYLFIHLSVDQHHIIIYTRGNQCTKCQNSFPWLTHTASFVKDKRYLCIERQKSEQQITDQRKILC